MTNAVFKAGKWNLHSAILKKPKKGQKITLSGFGQCGTASVNGDWFVKSALLEDDSAITVRLRRKK